MVWNIASNIADQQFCPEYGCIINNIAETIFSDIAESTILLAIMLNNQQNYWIINDITGNIYFFLNL